MKSEIIDPISDAIEFLLSESQGRRQEPWTPAEFSELKAAAKRKTAPDHAADVYRAMICHKHDWSYRAGAADINQIESWRAADCG